MWRLWSVAAAILVLTGCVQLPPTPEDLQAKRFEPAAGKAVLYLVRTNPDLGDVPATVMLDDRMMGATYQGTYFRWELPAGRHRIAGYAGDSGWITVDLQPDRMYFVRQVVRGAERAPTPNSYFYMLNDSEGRAAVRNALLVGQL